MTSDGTWSYNWERGRQLASMSNGSTTWSYTYNNDGMRVKRTNGSTTYTYFYNGNLLRYLDINGTKLYFVLDANGQPLEVSYCPLGDADIQIYYFAKNLQGANHDFASFNLFSYCGNDPVSCVYSSSQF